MKKLSLTAVLPVLALTLGACGQSAAPAAAQSAEVAGSLELAALPARTLPPVQAPWSYNIGGSDALNAGSTPTGKVISLDLYAVNQASINRLKAAGKYVICYYSAGTSENYRDDAESLKLLAPSLNLGQVLRGTGAVWEGEKWLDIRGFSATSTTARIATIRTVMTARLNLARSKGCAAVEPDNVDAWDNVVNQGAPAGTPPDAISPADQLAYNRWTADAAHAQGLSVLLKNDLGQAVALQASYDGALNEECYDFGTDCQKLTPFRDANKAIYVVEYKPASFATTARKTLANQLHLNVILTDADVTRLNPYGRFGAW
jgi:hypothetical protein